MEAAGFRPGRCCRSLRLRKQSRGTRQTVPPGCGSQASCEAVRSIHQLQPRYTQQRKPQWTRPLEQIFETARCDVRFGDVPTRCIEPEDLTIIGHTGDLLADIYARNLTHIYILPQCSTTAARVLNSAGMDAHFVRTRCAISHGILNFTEVIGKAKR